MFIIIVIVIIIIIILNSLKKNTAVFFFYLFLSFLQIMHGIKNVNETSSIFKCLLDNAITILLIVYYTVYFIKYLIKDTADVYLRLTNVPQEVSFMSWKKQYFV